MNGIDINVRAYTSNKIREFRKQNGWTQKDLGDRLGVKFNTVSGWENAVSEPLQNQLFTMAKLFGVSINDLFPPTTKNRALNQDELELIKNYRNLNPEGQRAAAKLIKGFTNDSDYRLEADKEKTVPESA